jgi:hypothetical protein
LREGWSRTRALTTPNLQWSWGAYEKPANQYLKARFRQLMLWRLGRFCPRGMIWEILWGDDPHGGPRNPSNIIALLVFDLRRDGWKIENRWGQGYTCIEAGR